MTNRMIIVNAASGEVSFGEMLGSSDPSTRTVILPDGTVRPYTPAENAIADADAAQQSQQVVAQSLATDTKTDIQRVQGAIDKLATLLGDTATPGSIRAILGATTDPAGTTSLRALSAQSNTVVVNAASIKALIGLTIDIAQLAIDQARASRKVARQVQRLGLIQTSTLTSADVGLDI